MGEKRALYLKYYLSPSVAKVKLSERTRSTQGSLYIYSNYTTGFSANNKSIIEKLIDIHGLQIVKWK